MANTKGYSMREMILDKYLGTRKEFTRKQLHELVNKDLSKRDMKTITSKQTIITDIDEMNGKFNQVYKKDGIVFDDRRGIRYYRYADDITSIYNREMTPAEIEKLLNVRTLLNGLRGMPNLDWVDVMAVRFDQNMMGDNRLVVTFEDGARKDAEFFQYIFDAIVNKKVLKLRYQKFGSEPSERQICPYFLRQYNHRWYMYVHDEKRDGIVCFALDRIVSVKELKDAEYIDTDIDFSHYFDNVVGATVPKGGVVERIVLRVDEWVANYLQTYPIHRSQKIGPIENGTCDLTLDLIITYELEQELLVYGEHVTVISPSSFRDKMAARALKIMANYR